VAEGTVVLGEVGLTGEVRAISQAETRVSEIQKMGFKKCLLPESNLKRMAGIDKIELAGIKNISEAMELLF
jgi:DNA repair protein RadA/Sms